MQPVDTIIEELRLVSGVGSLMVKLVVKIENDSTTTSRCRMVLLLLKLDKQISGNIYRPLFAMTEAFFLEGEVPYICLFALSKISQQEAIWAVAMV